MSNNPQPTRPLSARKSKSNVNLGLALPLIVVLVYLAWHGWQMLSSDTIYYLMFERVPFDGVLSVSLCFIGLISIALGYPRLAPFFAIAACLIAVHDISVSFINFSSPLVVALKGLPAAFNAVNSHIVMAPQDAIIVMLMSAGLYRSSSRHVLLPGEELIIGCLITTMAAMQLLFKAVASYAVTQTMMNEADNSLFCYSIMCLGGGFISLGALRLLDTQGPRGLLIYASSFLLPVSLTMAGFIFLQQNSQSHNEKDRVVVMSAAINEIRQDILQTAYTVSKLKQTLLIGMDRRDMDMLVHELLPVLGSSTDLYLTHDIDQLLSLTNEPIREQDGYSNEDGCYELSTVEANYYKACRLNAADDAQPVWMVGAIKLNNHSAIRNLNNLKDVTNVAFRHRDTANFVRDTGIDEINRHGSNRIVPQSLELSYQLNSDSASQSTNLLFLSYTTFVAIALAIATIGGMRNLKRTLNYSHRIFDNANTAQLITDMNGLGLIANCAACTLFDKESVHGLTLAEMGVQGFEGVSPTKIENLRTTIKQTTEGSAIPVSYFATDVGLPDGGNGWLVSLIDLREEEAQLQKLDSQRDINKIILSSAQDGIVGIGLNKHIAFINESAEVMLGYAPGTLEAKSILDVVSPDPDSNERRLFNVLLTNGGHRKINTRFLTADGRMLPVSVSLSPASDEVHALTSILIFHDASDEVDKEESLHESMHRLGEMNEQQTAFTNAIGHTILSVLDKASMNISANQTADLHDNKNFGVRLQEMADQHKHLKTLANYTIEYANAPHKLAPCRYISGESIFKAVKDINWSIQSDSDVKLEFTGGHETVLCNKEMLVRALEKLILYIHKKAVSQDSEEPIKISIHHPYDTLSEIRIAAYGLIPSLSEFTDISDLTKEIDSPSLLNGVELIIAKQLINSIGGDLALEALNKGFSYFKIMLAREK